MPVGKLLDTSTVAKRLNLSRDSVARLFREGRLPGAIRVGGRWRLPEDELNLYLKRQTRHPTKVE